MYDLQDEDVFNTLTNPTVNGTNTHFVSDCPFCLKEKHLYVQKKTHKIDFRGNNMSFMWQCKKCEEKGSLVRLLAKLQRLDLIKFGKSVNTMTIMLPELLVQIASLQPTDIDLPEIVKPYGWRALSKHPYLEKRGFEQYQYGLYKVGLCLEPNLKDYVVFLQHEQQRIVGYVGRYVLPNNTRPRYNNSITDAGKMIGGYDEVTSQTHTAILVEGLFSKKAVDNALQLHRQQSVKCLVTFGKSISLHQLMKLLRLGIKKIILLQDPDAVETTRNIAFCVEQWFETKVACLRKGDPDEVSAQEIVDVVSQAKSPIEYYCSELKPLKKQRLYDVSRFR
jgi:hypothetical protein